MPIQTNKVRVGRCPAPLPHLALLGVADSRPCPLISGVPRGWGQGAGGGVGGGPRAQALEGALGQLVGGEF